jgi:GNAT superfamily N-acetyltransferase
LIEILEQTDPRALADLKRDYLASQVAPVDGMWEALGQMGQHREIVSAGKSVGYFCVNEEGMLLQFFVTARCERLAPEIFAATVARAEVRGALVSTADHLFLGCCLDLQREVDVHTYLYQDQSPGQPGFDAGTEASLTLVEAQELEAITALQRQSLDQDLGDWLIGYLENLIARRELYALRLGGEVLATGELRVSDTQPPYADLGVITMRSARGQGLASHVLSRLKELCYERELAPICSTSIENVASQRAIARAGFVSRHRLLQISF